MRIEVTIERLVVEGLDVPDPAALQAAVQAELGRLLATQGLPPAWQRSAEIPALDGGTIQPSEPGGLGRQVAGAVYGGGQR